MINFVEECRREWKRLGVPDPVANEMAADLESDLREAESEGASAEEVLGSGAFDPRSFAASWATERGVIQRSTGASEPSPSTAGIPPRRSRMLAALAVSGFVVLIGAALAVHRVGSAQAFRLPLIRHIVLPPSAPPARAFALPMNIPGANPATLGLILLFLGFVGLILSILYWSPGATTYRCARRRPHGNQTPRGPSYS